MSLKRVYPDTNVALHYRPFDEIDWCTLVGATEVHLVITVVFLRELDQHKDRSRGAIQKRARRVSSWLAALRKSSCWEIRPGVHVVVDATEPEAMFLAALGLEAGINDDKIVGCMMRDKDRDPEADVVCVTADSGLTFKADGRKIVVVEPPPEKRLDDEPDERELENRDLRRQLDEARKLARAMPEFVLGFGDLKTHTSVRLLVLAPLDEQTLEEIVEAERRMMSMTDSVLSNVMFEPPSQAEKTRYFAKLVAWVRAGGFARGAARGLTFSVQIVLRNKGTGNAENTDIDLRFPEFVFVKERRDLPIADSRPERPQPSERLAKFDLRNPRRPHEYGFSSLAGMRVKSRFETVLSTKEPHAAMVKLPHLKHQTDLKLPRFDAWFESADDIPDGFQIGYRVHSASTPNITTEKLHVRLDVIQRQACIQDLAGAPDGDDAGDGTYE